MSPQLVLFHRHPFAPAALPAFIATMDGSDFPTRSASSSLSTLVQSFGLFSVVTGSPWLPHALHSSSIGLRIPGGLKALAFSALCVAACGCRDILGPFQCVPFRDYHLHADSPPAFNLACSRNYVSDDSLPHRLQVSILGRWLTSTQAGFSPARTCGIAMPHRDPAPSDDRAVFSVSRRPSSGLLWAGSSHRTGV